jgi:hypothetical protein
MRLKTDETLETSFSNTCKNTHEKLLQNICNNEIKHLQYMCETYATSKKKHTCKVRLKKQMKHLKQILATYVYNHLYHTSETSETYTRNMRFQRNISLLLGRMQARRHMEFTGASGLVTLVGGGLAAPAARHGRETSTGRQRPHD